MANIMYQCLQIAGHPDTVEEAKIAMAGDEHKICLKAICPVPQELLDVCKKFKQLASVQSWKENNWGSTQDIGGCDLEWHEPEGVWFDWIDRAEVQVDKESLEWVQQIRFWTYGNIIELPLDIISKTFPELLICLCAVDEFNNVGYIGIWQGIAQYSEEYNDPSDNNKLHPQVIYRARGE